MFLIFNQVYNLFVEVSGGSAYDNAMQTIGKHVIFSGRVQGVGFRYSTHRVASRYEVTGYVKNLPNGSVEVLLQGTKANVQACLDDLQNTMSGYIRQTQINERPVNPRYHDFRITY